MNTWKTLSKKTILPYSKFLTVEEHAVELPDGRIIEDWPWVVTPDYINVALITTEGQFVCMRQFKYGAGHTILAPVGGYLEPGEEPLHAAQREVLEETGYEATDWHQFGSYPVDGNRGCGTAHLFLAQGAHRVAEPDADDLEHQEQLLLSKAEVEAAVLRGDFKILAWQMVMVLALWHLERLTICTERTIQ
jgi:ADP-ribose pyrophosphatase